MIDSNKIMDRAYQHMDEIKAGVEILEEELVNIKDWTNRTDVVEYLQQVDNFVFSAWTALGKTRIKKD